MHFSNNRCFHNITLYEIKLKSNNLQHHYIRHIKKDSLKLMANLSQTFGTDFSIANKFANISRCCGQLFAVWSEFCDKTLSVSVWHSLSAHVTVSLTHISASAVIRGRDGETSRVSVDDKSSSCSQSGWGDFWELKEWPAVTSGYTLGWFVRPPKKCITKKSLS